MLYTIRYTSKTRKLGYAKNENLLWYERVYVILVLKIGCYTHTETHIFGVLPKYQQKHGVYCCVCVCVLVHNNNNRRYVCDRSARRVGSAVRSQKKTGINIILFECQLLLVCVCVCVFLILKMLFQSINYMKCQSQTMIVSVCVCFSMKWGTVA